MNRAPLFAALVGVAFAALSPAFAGDSDDNIVIIPRGEPVMVDPVAHARPIAVAGLSAAEAAGLTRNDHVIAAANAGADGDERQGGGGRGRSRGRGTAGAQLAAAAGLSQEAARNLSLDQVVAIKFDRDESLSDRQAGC